MSLWTSTIICVLLFQTVAVDMKKDWNVTQAYSDVFKILSNQNTCSDFYGGPRTATTVLNGFVVRVKSQSLLREVSFQMEGSPRLIRDPETGASYRLFELGHLIQGEDGEWLIPDDGHDGIHSKANTLRVQKMCRKELDALQ